MAVSLFRRWRSQKFKDLVGQESVVSTLQNVLMSGSPARAYLFCGPRGTGKTSSARIFAKAINCERGPAPEPCGECHQCVSIAEGNNLDVFEIDAASHTQVDKIRDFIVEKVHFTPVSARHKIYIIDEVHKLSTSSFNALLKTLEEPPSHVVFILATTHPHEMPATILSRCQRYDFKPLTASETEKHLTMIAKAENLDVDPDATRQLARAADGSLRDALVLFEQSVVFSDGRVTREKVLDLLGGVGYEVLEEMLLDLVGGRTAEALRRLDDWIGRGRDLKRLAESFQEHLRMMLLLKVKSEDQSIRHLAAEERQSLERLCAALTVGAITSWLRQVMELLAAMRHGHAARLEWEMLLVACAQPEIDPSLQGLDRRLERLEAGGVPAVAAAAALASPSPVDDRVLARLEALEANEGPGHDPRLWEKLSRLEAELDAWKDRLLHSQEAVQGEESYESLPAKSAAVTVSTVAEIAPVPTPVVETRVEPPVPQPAAPVPTAASGGEALLTDVVDDWLEMPPVLVNPEDFRRELPLFSSYTAAPEPEPVTPEPEIAPEVVLAEIEAIEAEAAEPVESGPVVEAEEPARLATERQPEAGEQVEAAESAEQAAEMVSIVESVQIVEETTINVEAETVTVVETVGVVEQVEVVTTPVAKAPAPEVKTSGASAPLKDIKEFWHRLMQGVKLQDVRLYAVLADARLTNVEQARFDIALPAGFDWHMGKVQEGRKLLEAVASQLAGRTLSMEVSLGGEKAAPPKDSEHDDLVARANGVFGGASIVE